MWSLLVASLTVTPGVWVGIEGPGYFRLMDQGRIVAAKEMSLSVVEGEVRDADGRGLVPAVRAKATEIAVEPDGAIVSVTPSGRFVIGRLMLALFPEGAQSEKRGNVFVFADRAKLVSPGGEAGSLKLKGAPTKPSATPTPQTSETKSKAKIVVKAEIETDRETVTLGDLAEIEAAGDIKQKLAEIVVAETPPFRTRASLSRLTLERKLQQAGFNPDAYDLNLAGTTFVKRASRTLAGNAIVEDAKKAVAQRGTPAEALVAEGSVADLDLPTGEVRVESNVFENSLTFSVQLAYIHNGVRVGTRSVRLKASNEAIGVLRNEPVKLVLRSAGARVEVDAKAASDGLIGNRVTVRLDSGKTHQGTVVSRGVVEVNL